MEQATEIVLPVPILVEPGDTLIPRHSPDIISYSTATYQSEYARTPDVITAAPAAPQTETAQPSIGERWKFSTTRRKIGAIATAATALLAASSATVFEASPAAADSSAVYMVTGTEIGVYARNSPHENDTKRIDGIGAYDGDRIQEICGVVDGDPVGRRNNHTWHKINDLDRPSAGTFWISDHWLNTPNGPNELTPGEKNCVDTTQKTPDTVVNNPGTPNYKGNCKVDNGQVALESWSKAFASLYGDDNELKGQLENYAVLWGNPSADIICVGAQLSNFDSTNQQQFVSSVTSVAPDIAPGSCKGNDLVEIWGDGFYKKTPCTSPYEWKINRWLKNGTYVCAARSDAADVYAANNTDELADAVKSGKVKLGSADPFRQIACVAIKG